jgi:alpha-glucosidase (family GH31 glycosyl hydrolase)
VLPQERLRHGVDGWWPDKGDQLDIAARDLLVPPIVEPGATSRKVYLPRGAWCDFWSSERVNGGIEINRESTSRPFRSTSALEPFCLLVRGNNRWRKMWTSGSSTIYPGADGSFSLFEDGSISFNYRKSEWMGVQMVWHDARGVRSLSLASGSHMLPPSRRGIEVRPGQITRAVVFEGKSLEVSL